MGYEQAKAVISTVRKEALSGQFSQDQAKALANGVAFIAAAQGKYMAAEAQFKDARSMYKKEVAQLRREARKKSLAVPESIELFGKQLDDSVKASADRAKQLNE